jgi:gamma-glutamylcyclotransferase (GGCT)/AIG2-like uncharacterized protein YtfP
MRYFAYGANMDVAAMAGRCPGAALLGIARLPGYRFVIAHAGYASLEPDPAADVHGVLWHLTPRDVELLDVFEGVPEGLYRKAVFSIDGGPALVYVPADRARGKPAPGYIAGVVAAAMVHGLPEDYIKELRGWG